MMVRGLRCLADAIDECEGLREVGEAELPLQSAVDLMPAFGHLAKSCNPICGATGISGTTSTEGAV